LTQKCVRVVEEQVLISVQDFGIGIPKHHQERIFERFYRVYEDKNTTYPGLGIGLYLSREIIERHAGRIWVESVEGQGTTVSFTLPLHVNLQGEED
jgi:signal transduction histidine kinase